jgi:hypothetical protein
MALAPDDVLTVCSSEVYRAVHRMIPRQITDVPAIITGSSAHLAPAGAFLHWHLLHNQMTAQVHRTAEGGADADIRPEQY